MWLLGALGIALAAVPCLAGEPRGSVSETAVLRCGLRIRYRTVGSETGTPVLLVHGYSLSSATWERVQRLMPDEFRTVALDLPGFGDSDKPETGYSYSELVETVVQFMDALRMEKAVVVGHSFGGDLAQHLAAGHPGRLLALVVSNATAENLPPKGLTEAVQKRMASYGSHETNRAIFQKSMTRYFDSANLREGELGAFVETGLKASNTALRKTLETMYSTPAIPASQYSKILVPTLVVVGTHDPFGTFDHAVAISDAIPGSRVAVVPRCGHSPMWEKPDEYVALLVSFLDGLESAGRAGADRARALR